ncbi:MAG TPA: excalibur calcium-binding domain-containing protein [Cellvibrionaceae bacterium]
MNKFIVLALMIFIAWTFYQKNISLSTPIIDTQALQQKLPEGTPLDDKPPPKTIKFNSPDKSTTQATVRYRCDGRQHCSQMRSRGEAEWFLKNCPNMKMDGDNDGIPCERDSRF